MDNLSYLDFDIDVERFGVAYRIVINSPAGQLTQDLTIPFSDLEIENALLRFGRPQRGVRRIETPEAEAARTFGSRLFAAVFDGEARACLRSSIDEAQRQNAGLRLRLRLTGTPELTDLPWEFLYTPTLNRFLALSSQTPLVRYLEMPERVRPLAITPPLRILAVIASPRGYPPLNVEDEWQKLSSALADLQTRGLVQLERLKAPTLSALQHQLRRGSYHILHFVGHGSFDQQQQDGVLLMEDNEGYGARVSSRDLGVILHDHGALRLVVLNACEGGRSSRTDPFAGTAQTLVQQGIPAVIAMQFPVTDEAAIIFSQGFYGALADGYPVDGGLAEARKELLSGGSGTEWGTPVLYMRSPDGRIFNLTTTQAGRDPRSRSDTIQAEAEAALKQGHWAVATERLQALLAQVPNHAQARELLQHAQVQQKLAILYNQGRKHIAAMRWAEALEAFKQVRAIDPEYKEVRALIRSISRSSTIANQSISPALIAPPAEAAAPANQLLERMLGEMSPAPPARKQMPVQAVAPIEVRGAPDLLFRLRQLARSRWMWLGAGFAWVALVTFGLWQLHALPFQSSQASDNAAIAQPGLLQPTAAPILDHRLDVAAKVAPVDPDKHMVLIGQLEPINGAPPDPAKTRLLFESLKGSYEVDNPGAKLQIRLSPATLRSADDALAAAEANRALIVVWGNYDRDSILLHIDVGSFKALPKVVFEHTLLERTANLEVTLTDLRQQSVAPQVLNSYQWLAIATGDSFAVARIAVLLEHMQVASPDPNPAKNNVAAHLYRAWQLYYVDTKRALAEINSAKELDPSNPFILSLRSLAFTRLGQFNAAIQDAQSSARLAPREWGEPAVLEGTAYSLGGDCAPAISSFDVAINARPYDWFPIFLRGFCYQLLQNYPPARADLERALRLQPEASYPYLALMILDLREGHLNDAKQRIGVVQQRFTDTDLATRQMRAFFAAEGEQSQFAFLTASSGNLALGLYQNVEQYTQFGLNILSQLMAAESSPDALAHRKAIFADLSFQRGFAQCNLGKFAEAEQTYSDGIAADPSFTLLYLLRAEVRLRQGNQPGAAEDMAAAQQNAPSSNFDAMLQAAQAGQLSCETMLTP